MRKSKLYILALTTALIMPLSSCKETIIYVTPDDVPNDDIKTPIELSVGGVDAPAMTRAAVITDDPYNPQNFTMNTKIFMVMKSEYGTTDYQGSHTAKYTVTRGDVAAGSNEVTFDNYNQRYWDDAHARSSQLSIWAYAQQGIPENDGWLSATFQIPNSTWSPISPETPEHLLQEYVSHQFLTNNVTNPWENEVTGHVKGAIYPCIMIWKASHNDSKAQDANSLKYQDLLFSNNLVNYDTDKNDASKNKSLKFDFGTRKFPQSGDAQMYFYHAMSKITIKIIEGDGFNTSSDADFQFTPTTSNVKLIGFNTEGTFNIKNGYFEKVDQHYDIPSIAKTVNKGVNPDPYYTLEALAIPNIYGINESTDGNSRFVSGKKNLATDVMMEFTIDNNKYQVTSGQLYDALHEGGVPTGALVANATEKTNNGTTYIPLEAGKNYVFTFTIGKTKIKDITAQVAGWEEVAAEPINPSNARIKLQLEERGTAVTAPVDIYRAADNPSAVSDTWESYKWTTGYVDNKNVFNHIDTNGDGTEDTWKLTNDWFWDNNMTYYHFRAIMPINQTVQTNTTPDPDEDYVSLSSAVNYTDVLWGAPMRDVANNEDPDNFKFIYNKDNGFDVKNSNVDANKSQIYQAIGPTEDKLKLTLFHMISDLTIKIKTTTGADAVTLVDGSDNKTKVQLEGHYADGTVLLGTGLVKTTGSPTAKDRTTAPVIGWNSVNDDYQVYKYGVVPQDLTNVQLRITTPDNNEYIVSLYNVKASTVSNNNIANPYSKVGGTGADKDKYIIDRWYPGFKYNYSFTLAKTGITNLEATILDWETVEADNETVVIQ